MTTLHNCPRCKGTGSYLMEGDLHRSAGFVPCDCIALRAEKDRREKAERERAERERDIQHRREQEEENTRRREALYDANNLNILTILTNASSPDCSPHRSSGDIGNSYSDESSSSE